MLYENIREESLKLKVAADWFPKFDCTDIIGRIDFAVKIKRTDNAVDFGDEYLLWAEAKQQPTDIYRMLAQLIITIKSDAADRVPPKFIGCFDNEKIAFVEYHNVLPIHQINDFNWTQTPSAVDDKTIETVRNTISTNEVFSFNFETDGMELRNFLKANFNLDTATNLLSTLIDKNNFIFIYQKWLKQVMPKINVDWAMLKKNYGIYDRDFFLAELNIDDNGTAEVHDDKTVNENFYVTFNSADSKPYELIRKDGFGLDASYKFGFHSGGLQQYTDFWKRYKRPPENEYWKYILERIDLLVPQDVRERKGAFFTPQIWVEKSQQYLADVLGENWQDEYYVWDCCAGTGNLLNGLNNKYNVWASTLDQQDVDVMHERIRNGANLLDGHVFQFDFLNDDFSKCPQGLQDIINNPERCRKLVVYINPPYAEATASDTIIGTIKHKAGVAANKTYSKYLEKLGRGVNEVFAQFFTRIYCELPNCILAEFSKLKILQAQNFSDFRNFFLAKLEKMFMVPANSFDNVTGQFPIGFMIWNTSKKMLFKDILSDVYNKNGEFICEKSISTVEKNKVILNWMQQFYDKKNERLAYMVRGASDFQNNKIVFITNGPSKAVIEHSQTHDITQNNLIENGIFFSVRHIIESTWFNDRDQFLYPNEGWKNDNEFQTNCLVWTLFNNNIQSKYGINHWIPFTESEVDAKERFESHFMSDFLAGKINSEQPKDLFSDVDAGVETRRDKPLQITPESQAVMAAGRELWRYYHTMEDANPNASLYDIKEYFQGRDDKGRMNAKSDDKHYTELLENLKSAMQALADQIRPKVYEYGFLK